MGDKARILIVDQDRPTVMLISSVLERQGYEIHTAFDGAAGWKKAREIKPDLIILDARVPGMDGYQVCRRLRRDPDTARIVVLMLAAEGKVGKGMRKDRRFALYIRDQLRGFDVGAAEVLAKPVKAKELVRRVKSLLWASGFMN